MDSRTLSTVRKASEAQQERIKRENNALTAAAERVRQEDQRRYSENFQAQQQQAAREGFMWPR